MPRARGRSTRRWTSLARAGATLVGHRAAARAVRDSGLLPDRDGRGLARTSRATTACATGYRATLDKDDGLQAMYDRTRDEGFGAEVKRRIMLGTYVLSAGYYDAYYLKAQQVRTLLRQDYEHAFEAVDVVAMPTTPTPAFRLGEKTDDPLQMYLSGRVHGQRQPRRPAGDQRAVRTLSGPAADRPAVDGPDVRRGDAAARGRRVPA